VNHDVPLLGHRARPGRRRRLDSRIGLDDGGSALVETAILLPLLVLLLVGGVDIGLAVTERFQLQAGAQLCADALLEDECASHAAAIGATLTCFQTEPEHCWDDGLTVDRVTVRLQAVFDGIVLPNFTLAAVATGRSGGEAT
jgi:uncharacterized membrane protein